MAVQSLGEAVGWMLRSPYVWLSGLWTAAILLISWYLYTNIGIMTAFSVAFVLAFVLPALIAGTYGIVAESESSFRVFRRYAVCCYFRQLLTSILVFLIAWVFSQFISYMLLVLGFGMGASMQVALFVFIPVIFFCYFADVTAVINEKRIFASVKDSFLRVANGSFSHLRWCLPGLQRLRCVRCFLSRCLRCIRSVSLEGRLLWFCRICLPVSR